MITDIERRQRHRDACRRYCSEHPDRVHAGQSAYKATHKKEIHEYYMANREATIVRAAQWKAAHPEKEAEYYAAHIDKVRAHHVEYYQAHRVEADAKNAIWCQAHPDLMRAIKAKSQKAHPETMRKAKAKRRVLGFVPLNRAFADCEGHHIDAERVIHIPHELHESVRHNVFTGKNMAKINAIAYNFLFKQEVGAALEVGRNG